MEHRGDVELRQVPCAHRLDHHAIHAHGLSLSPRSVRSGRTPRSIRTKPVGLLFCVYCDVRTRHRTNWNPRGLISPDLVSAFYRALRRAGCNWSYCTPTRVRSFLRVVSTDHATGLGACRTATSRRSPITSPCAWASSA